MYVCIRDRPKFGFGFGFGAESRKIPSFGKISVSAETKKLTFGFLSFSAESDADFRPSTEGHFIYSLVPQ